uniref:Ribonuclease T2, like n=1 Tax=Takifugu rubripes TaxID=31033 RepID=A0A3B5KEP3_TAKRU
MLDPVTVLFSDWSGDTTSCSWRCLLLTLQWPGAFCQSLGEGRVCQIPPSVNHWTLHGLWPVREDRCCDCWPMFHSDVQEVEAELLVHWPSLLRHDSSFQFWRNEWRKHGSCAACVEGINSPLRYFQLCLKLRRQFNIDQVLEDAGITPSCHRTYKDREVWFQIKIPLSRNLTAGCSPAADAEADWRSSGGHPCPPQVPFFYLPINHEQPKEPCG